MHIKYFPLLPRFSVRNVKFNACLTVTALFIYKCAIYLPVKLR